MSGLPDPLAGLVASIQYPDAGAYDTCFFLGQCHLYAHVADEVLPEAVEQYYRQWGDDTLKSATLGWQRARIGWHEGGAMSIREWLPAKIVPLERGLRGPRKQRTFHYTDGVRIMCSEVELVGTPDVRTPSKWGTRKDRLAAGSASDHDGDGPPPPPPTYLVEVDVDQVVFSKALLSKLGKDTRAELKALLSPRQYENAHGHQVFSRLRYQSRGLTSRESMLVKDLRRELRWAAPGGTPRDRLATLLAG